MYDRHKIGRRARYFSPQTQARPRPGIVVITYTGANAASTQTPTKILRDSMTKALLLKQVKPLRRSHYLIEWHLQQALAREPTYTLHVLF